jgi:hypothetical protein
MAWNKTFPIENPIAIPIGPNLNDRTTPNKRENRVITKYGFT